MLIECKEVDKHLGSFHLEQISFELPKGYIMGLIGPNGAYIYRQLCLKS